MKRLYFYIIKVLRKSIKQNKNKTKQNKTKKKKKTKQKQNVSNTALRDPRSKQLNADRSPVFMTFHAKNVGKKKKQGRNFQTQIYFSLFKIVINLRVIRKYNAFDCLYFFEIHAIRRAHNRLLFHNFVHGIHFLYLFLFFIL